MVHMSSHPSPFPWPWRILAMNYSTVTSWDTSESSEKYWLFGMVFKIKLIFYPQSKPTSYFMNEVRTLVLHDHHFSTLSLHLQTWPGMFPIYHFMDAHGPSQESLLSSPIPWHRARDTSALRIVAYLTLESCFNVLTHQMSLLTRDWREGFVQDLRATYDWAEHSPNILATRIQLSPLYLFVADIQFLLILGAWNHRLKLESYTVLF